MTEDIYFFLLYISKLILIQFRESGKHRNCLKNIRKKRKKEKNNLQSYTKLSVWADTQILKSMLAFILLNIILQTSPMILNNLFKTLTTEKKSRSTYCFFGRVNMVNQ